MVGNTTDPILSRGSFNTNCSPMFSLGLPSTYSLSLLPFTSNLGGMLQLLLNNEVGWRKRRKEGSEVSGSLSCVVVNKLSLSEEAFGSLWASARFIRPIQL